MTKDIIKEAEKLISDNQSEEARVLLLNAGFVDKFDPELKDVYLQFFPPTPELDNELSKSLMELADQDDKIRLKAAIYINKQARGDWNVKQRGWLRDPRTVEILIKALDDTNIKVVFEVTIALGMIVQRYNYHDRRIYSGLVKLFPSTTDEVKIKIAQAIASFDIKDKWDYIFKILKCKPLKVARHAVGLTVSRYGEHMEKATKSKMIAALLVAYQTEKDLNAKISLIKGLREIGNQHLLPDLNQFLTQETEKVLKGEIEYAIKVVGVR